MFCICVALIGPPSARAGETEHLCFGRPATIVGTDGHDVLEGTSGSDVIVGLKGADEISGRGGADYICSGPGARRLYDDDFGEYYWSGDRVITGSGDDQIDLGPGRNYALTGPGDDFVIGGDRFDYVVTQTGNDTLDLQAGGSYADGGGGDDAITSGEGIDRIVGGPDNDTISSGGGDDEITPTTGDDTVDGGEGRDLLELGLTTCGNGCLSTHRRDIQVDLAAGMATGLGTDSVAAIEDVRTGEGDDVLLGNDSDNRLEGHSQDSTSADHNIYKGRGGDDTFFTSVGRDLLTGGPGTDVIWFVYAECDLRIDLRADRATGCVTDRLWTIEGANSGLGGDVFIGDAGPNFFDGDWGADVAKGLGGDDVLRGDRDRDDLFGGSGADALFGEHGRDELYGGVDDDRLRGGGQADFNDGGDGMDACASPGPAAGARNCESEL